MGIDDKDLDKILARTEYDLIGDDYSTMKGQTNFGKLVAEAMRVISGADFGYMNGGFIRKTIKKGNITKRMILGSCRFQNRLLVIYVTGRDIKNMLEHGVSHLPGISGGFPQISGLRFTIDPSKPSGKRITLISVNGSDAKDDDYYTAAISDFMFDGGDGYTFIKENMLLNDVTTVHDAIGRYLAINNVISMK